MVQNKTQHVAPLKMEVMDCSPLVVDDGFEVANKDLLASWIAELCLGNYLHLREVIEQLNPDIPISENEAIDAVIELLEVPSDNKTLVERRDGWLFQMMSWIALNLDLHHKFKPEQFEMAPPHTKPGQHGLDGIAVVLDDDMNIDRIIITEDKCSTWPENIIKNQVFPEYDSFEKRKLDNRIKTGVTALIIPIGGRQVAIKLNNDIARLDYRRYRVGITRKEEHESLEGRKKLYTGYDSHVKGNVERRMAASVFLPDLRNWMSDLSNKVVKVLNSKKTGNV